MKYTVFWRPEAEAEPARLWLDTSHREDVASAANGIEALLRDQAPTVGESRSNGRRIVFLPPLAVVYRVYESDKKALVQQLWFYAKRQ